MDGVPSLLDRHQPTPAIDVHVFAGSASCEQVGEAVAARASSEVSVMTGSLATKGAWGSRRSDAIEKGSGGEVKVLSSVLRTSFPGFLPPPTARSGRRERGKLKVAKSLRQLDDGICRHGTIPPVQSPESFWI